MNEPASKKRRVRKGTRSCWECRRRKVKCRFDHEGDVKCLNCIDYDTPCVSQKDSEGPGPSLASTTQATPCGEASTHEREDGALTQRIDRLEQLLLKIASGEQTAAVGLPPSTTVTAEGPRMLSCAPMNDLFNGSAATNAHEIAAANSTAFNESILTPGSSEVTIPRNATSTAHSPVSQESSSTTYTHVLAQQKGTQQRLRQLSFRLHALLPSPDLRNVLAFESPGASMILGCAHSRDDQIAGRTEPHWSLASASWPTRDTHPVLIAKRLIQYSVCMQYLPPNMDPTRIQLPDHQQPCELVGQWIATVTDLTGDDELMGCAEGLEVLTLLSMFQAESGHLRRAWMTTRRALDLGRLLGIDRPVPPPIRSCAAQSDPKTTPSMTILWYRLNCSDRYHSLILGLTPSTHKDNFIHATPVSSERELDILSKAHSVIARKIADRNDLPPRSTEAYSVTQSIEEEFERAAAEMGPGWWESSFVHSAVLPDLTLWRGSTSQIMSARSRLYMQVRHYTLLILLHLPFLLQVGNGGTYAHNHGSCMSASRAVLERFLFFRKGNLMNISGRPIDYSALIAGMTLLLGYLVRGTGDDRKQSDRELVEETLIAFRELGAYKRDPLAAESAETLSQLLPIITTNSSQHPLRLKVPFLGTVNITARPTTAASFDAQPPSGGFPGPTPFPGSVETNFELDARPLLTFDTTGIPGSNPDAASASEETNCSYVPPDWEDWVFQGIDTTYWSTLNDSVNGIAENPFSGTT
ncbi:uncharacterized protein E0L32_010882 [Thyridium curvatum]|uniref:Zn(2)-C6 fungal-type domain-containing protein n=1 Tax=Thyridium curvatum TaxID=1093900 RepID=A0A507AQM6_9PEZI|nr:uncharacterized protein E0L32_010882 [Thyridium curvatum]TPX07179.1 hypothetical protein E0L32_010882 [Thyridium curvatum]